MRHSREVDVLTDVSRLLVHQSELIIIEVEQEVLGLGDERGTDHVGGTEGLLVLLVGEDVSSPSCTRSPVTSVRTS